MKRGLRLSRYFLLFILVFSCSRAKQFKIVTLPPVFEVNGQGENIDSIAFWEAPDPSNTLMFVTAKGNSLVEIWKFPFKDNEQNPLVHSTFAQSPVNGVWVDQEDDLLYVSIGSPSSTVDVFHLPDLHFIKRIDTGGVDLKLEPNLTLLQSDDGKNRIYISADDIIYIHDAVTGKRINQFSAPHECETMVADHYYQVLYVPDENDRTGVYAYHPDGSDLVKKSKKRFGDNSIFQEDAEGIIIYFFLNNGEDTGAGLIVVADQRKDQTDFEVFDRRSWEYLGRFRIEGVSNTDGIASTQSVLPDYPKGLFAVINNDRSVACVGWDHILEAIGK